MNNSVCTIQENKLNSTPFNRCKELEPMHNLSNDKLEISFKQLRKKHANLSLCLNNTQSFKQ